MSLALEILPDDPDQLRAMLVAMSAEWDEARAEIDKLQLLISELQRMRFGQRSEQRERDQMQFGLEDQDQDQAEGDEEASEDAASSDTEKQGKKHAAPKRNHGHLPRIEPVETTCPCCDSQMHVIGADKSERLEIILAKLQVIVTRRPRYGCQACESAVVQALAPDRPITDGMAISGFLAHVLVSKYTDHCPLYRQSEILTRGGIELDRSTLANWVGKTCWWLRPVYDHLMETLFQSSKIFADEIKLPVLKPGNGKTKSGYLGDMRSMTGHGSGRRLHCWSMSMRTAGAASISPSIWSGSAASFRSTLMPATTSWKSRAGLRGRSSWRSAGRICAAGSTNSTNRPDRRSRKRRWSVLASSLRSRKRSAASQPSTASWSAIAYALNRWDGFNFFLGDDRIELDANVLERGIRPITLTRNYALFAGSDRGAEHWAMASSIIEACRLNHVEPFAYLKDVLERMVSGQIKANQIGQIMPWNWHQAG